MTRLSPAALVFCLVALSMVTGVASERFCRAAARAASRAAAGAAPRAAARRPNPAAEKTNKTAKPAKPAKTTRKKKAAIAAMAKSAGVKANGKVKGAAAAHARVEKAPQPPPMVGGRVAVFAFKGEETTSALVRTEVVNLLRSKGLNVMTTLLPVDSSEQYRDMAATLDLAVYVHGEVRDDGGRARAVVHIRSGISGRTIKSARFSGSSRDLPADVGQSLWGEVGPSFLRACAEAAKPRKGGRAPMRIEAGTPIEPSDTGEGT